MTQSLKLRKATQTEGGEKGANKLSVGSVSLPKHPDSCFKDVIHTLTDRRTHKPLTGKGHWRTTLHRLGTAKEGGDKM